MPSPPTSPSPKEPLQPWLHRLRAWWLDPRRALRPLLVPDDAPLDLSLVGRMLWHAALVGVAAGLMGAAFFAALEWMQDLLLEGLAGYRILRAAGEHDPRPLEAPFRPWLLRPEERRGGKGARA